jgi:hypothetical protein
LGAVAAMEVFSGLSGVVVVRRGLVSGVLPAGARLRVRRRQPLAVVGDEINVVCYHAQCRPVAVVVDEGNVVRRLDLESDPALAMVECRLSLKPRPCRPS